MSQESKSTTAKSHATQTTKNADANAQGPSGPRELPDTSKPDTKPDTVNGAGTPSVGGPPSEKRTKKVPLTHPYQVAPGRSIGCARGVLDGNNGDEIKAEWLGKDEVGVKALENLLAKGFVLKGPEKK